MAQFKYQQHCNAIIAAINDGTLQHGDKLESVRALAKRGGIGVSTAAHVYSELERQGWVKAVPKKGYFVFRPKAAVTPSYGEHFVGSSDLRALPLQTAVQYSLSMHDVLPLSCTAPSSVLDAEQMLNTAHRSALKARPYQLIYSDYHEDTTALRKAIAAHLYKDGIQVQPNDILLTNGRSDGLAIALRACGLLQGTVAIEAPSSYFFQAVLQQHGVETLAIPMQPGFDDELALLDKAHKQSGFGAYLFNPNYNDPTGRVLTVEQKRQFIEWAMKAGVTLIEYDRSELHFGEHRPVTTSALVDRHERCRVISISDFYDTLSDRFGLGYLICRNTRQDCELSGQIASESPLMASQQMMLSMLASGAYRRHVNKLRRQLASQCQRMQAILEPVLDERVYISRPEGGPCLWIGLPEGYSSQDLWQRLIEQKVAIAPGCLFTNTPQFDHYFRVTFGLPWDDWMEQGVHALGRTMAEILSDVQIQ